MGCLYCNFEGRCDFYPGIVKLGTDWKGFCMVEEDPNPADSCDSYESNTPICPECGEECENEEECELCGYCFNCGLMDCECEWE
jgi:hypothetical protein